MKKNIIIVITAMLLVGAMALTLVTAFQLVKMEQNNELLEAKLDEVLDCLEQFENEEVKQEEPVVTPSATQTNDPYEGYEDMVWSEQESKYTKIIDNKIYFGEKEVKANYIGKIKSIETIMLGGFPEISVLTEEGRVWSIVLDNVVDNIIGSEEELLINEKIIDMIALDIPTRPTVGKTMFFLTETGKLITKDGVDIDSIKECVDPYEDYKDLVFGVSEYSLDCSYDAAYEVVEGKLYYTSTITNETTKINGIYGNVIKLRNIVDAGEKAHIVLTDKGMAYLVSQGKIYIRSTSDLRGFDVIDITQIDGKIYYLTSSGKLISTSGNR